MAGRVPFLDQVMLAPRPHDSPHVEPRCMLRLTGTTAATSNGATVAMRQNTYATLIVGPTQDVAVRWGSASNVAAVQTADPIFSKGSIISWLVEDDTKYVSVISSDGASTYVADLYQSSP